MAISFPNLPANVRVPFFYAEVDASQAGYFAQNNRSLIIAQKLAAGTGAANTPHLVARTDEAKVLAGVGSMAARMHEVYRLNDPMGELWMILLDDDAAGVAAAGSIAIAGPATAAGTIVLYIAGQRVRVAVAAAATAATIATALAAAVNAVPSLPVTAAVDAEDTHVVNLACRWKGATGNDITIVTNYRGTAGAESTPAGLTLTITAMAGGSGDPDLADAIAAMGDEEYDHVILPYGDAASLDALATEMNDAAGRWSYARQVYGHVWSARRGALQALVTFGESRNDQHATIWGLEPGIPSPVWEAAAAWGARSAVYLNADPARPTQTGPLTGLLPAPPGSRFIMTERQSLLFAGIATAMTSGGALRIERSVTTYQKNLWNQDDPSYLDAETLFTLTYIIRVLRNRITTKYPRHKLANDGTRFGAGQAIVTPNIIRAELIAAYAELERAGIVENADAFAAALIVERNANDPNRVDTLFPPDLVNQLRVFATLVQFRLQYATV